ncbi:uncharacterized protein Z520_05922 [Fonsecaea multimorphosa CBS 102226]|uniref:DHHA2 domain-containing protein n=1 Tax=Fonsecaea multimorphosa CBS 102226 TaxID=1442371 RepID=A0A0D2INL5_9EURO|nr:uncharacterized protein Z520_05922 [Fonsecaea multimorphosa CBS 102226]KIX98621.1 hypothetical protein Z520_05922 [Fonsecaea multimorphosa CBS 102226]OAL24811.1 hypothetical protein AYO22_05600 [Fonsecaea multimorphosa]
MSGLRAGEAHTNGDREMRSLTTYFSSMRSLVLSSSGASSKSSQAFKGISQKPVLVMGNPSADLDSFVSAVVTSFCYNLAAGNGNATHANKPTYIPILNLPSVRASDLWRLRPEFGVAMRLALGESPETVGKEGREQGKTDALKELITIGDIKTDEGSALHKLFVDSGNPDATNERQPLFLVDHNAPAIPGVSDQAIAARFNVTACIDHHVDEDYIPRDADPRIVTTGIGSCTSLVVTHLRERGLWPSSPSSSSSTQHHQSGADVSSSPEVDAEMLQQISKLALAPILIDTWNLRAKGDKCSDTDREVVRFLESAIASSTARTETPERAQSGPKAADWDRDAFFSSIATAKANSLDLLTMQEVFDRDYKAWTERTSSGRGSKEINIGISSLVKPLSWLVSHTAADQKGDGDDGVDAFLAEIATFATSPARQLGVFCLLTRTGDGRKEVAVVVLDEDARGAVDAFEEKSRDELQLSNWAAADGDSSGGSEQARRLTEGLTRKFGEKGEWRIWWIGDTSKSRKQVGPLLREAVRDL